MKPFFWRGKLSLLLLLCLCHYYTNSQEKLPYHFLGICPAITAERYYEKGDIDINLLPFVYQQVLKGRTYLRLHTLMNYGIRSEKNYIILAGAEASLPVALRKQHTTGPLKGFFAGPVIGTGRAFRGKFTTAGVWAESGYAWLLPQNWGLQLCLQSGATLFFYDKSGKVVRNHFGIKFIAGKWW